MGNKSTPLMQGWPATVLILLMLFLILWDGQAETWFEWFGIFIVSPLLTLANFDTTLNGRRGIIWLRKQLGFKHP